VELVSPEEVESKGPVALDFEATLALLRRAGYEDWARD
jgi:hypothetical protein